MTKFFTFILLLALIGFDFAESFCDQQGESCSVKDNMTGKCYKCYNVMIDAYTFECRAGESCAVNSAYGGCAKCCRNNDIDCF